MITKTLLIFVTTLALASCASISEDKTDAGGLTSQQLYTLAYNEMSNGNYDSAIEAYQKLEVNYPYGPHAQQALLESAYAYYQNLEYPIAVTFIDRFLKLYPFHPHIDYALFLKGQVLQSSEVGVLRYFDNSNTRDPESSRQAISVYSELLKRFPESKYALEANQRVKEIYNNLAMFEMEVAEYYLEKGAWLAAVNRAKTVVTDYSKSDSLLHALQVMVEGYENMGLDDLKNDTMRVIEKNFNKKDES